MKVLGFKTLRDYVLTAVVAVVVAFFIRGFVIEAYRIPSSTMKPTLLPGDVIFVAKWPFKLLGQELPKRGDVIVFSDSNSLDYIRRVIGLPGDKVSIKKGHLYLNGVDLTQGPLGKSFKSVAYNSKSFEISRSYLKSPSKAPKLNERSECSAEKLPEGKSYQICSVGPFLNEDFGPEIVPKQSIFVMSDFRSEPLADNSRRSIPVEIMKGWGIIPAESVKGKALWVWLSIDTYREFGTPSHFLPRLRSERMFREVQ